MNISEDYLKVVVKNAVREALSRNSKETVEEKVTAMLLKHGNNPEDVRKMVGKHFESAYKKYSTVSSMAEFIRTIY